MNTYEVAKKIKQHLIKLAVKDKLPMDMEALDTAPIQKIIESYKNEELAGGWSWEDVMGQAKDDGVKITKKEAKEILRFIDMEADASVGINWEVISDFIRLYMDEKKK